MNSTVAAFVGFAGASITSPYLRVLLESSVPSSSWKITVYSLRSQTAVKFLSPVDPFTILTSSIVSPSFSDHPKNVYPVFVGVANVKVGVSTLYFLTRSDALPPSKS